MKFGAFQVRLHQLTDYLRTGFMPKARCLDPDLLAMCKRHYFKPLKHAAVGENIRREENKTPTQRDTTESCVNEPHQI